MIEARFLQRVLDAASITEAHSVHEAQTVQRRLRERLPRELHALLDALSGRERTPLLHVAIADAESFLLGVDEALGDGSGAVLSRVGQHLGTGYFFDTLAGTRTGDVARCVERLRMEVVRSFVGRDVLFEVVRVSTGLELVVQVPGWPRATRALRHLSVGYVRAAFTFALEPNSTILRVYAQSTGDRCTISARYRDDSEPIATAPRPVSRTKQVRARSLAAEVERILDPTQRRTLPPPAQVTASSAMFTTHAPPTLAAMTTPAPALNPSFANAPTLPAPAPQVNGLSMPSAGSISAGSASAGASSRVAASPHVVPLAQDVTPVPRAPDSTAVRPSLVATLPPPPMAASASPVRALSSLSPLGGSGPGRPFAADLNAAASARAAALTATVSDVPRVSETLESGTSPVVSLTSAFVATQNAEPRDAAAVVHDASAPGVAREASTPTRLNLHAPNLPRPPRVPNFGSSSGGGR